MNEEFLEPENMLKLYAMGAFPMADEIDNVDWYMPKKRAILPLDDYNVPRSLKKVLLAADYEVKFDTDFDSVIKGCANRTETWINDRLIEAYRELFKIGHLHTVEVYKGNKLAGGLYGVSIGGAFFGESMFTIVPQSSKIAFIKLIEHLNSRSFNLLDVQIINPHLAMFGAIEISKNEFNILLTLALENDVSFI